MTRAHFIYGLFVARYPRTYLYVGSGGDRRQPTPEIRLAQHRAGECRTTAKMAAKNGVRLLDLQMRVLHWWMSGQEPNPEGAMILAYQAKGHCRWNHPYALSTEDCRKQSIGIRRANLKRTREQCRVDGLKQPIEIRRANGQKTGRANLWRPGKPVPQQMVEARLANLTRMQAANVSLTPERRKAISHAANAALTREQRQTFARASNKARAIARGVAILQAKQGQWEAVTRPLPGGDRQHLLRACWSALLPNRPEPGKVRDEESSYE